MLTEIDHCVIAAVWRRGPCSGYVVRSDFTSSGTPHWRASAGAVYPALKRLEARGYIRSEVQKWGQNGRKVFTVSPTGKAALLAWVQNVEPVAGPAHDQLRTRLGFMDVLKSDADRCRLVEAAIEAVRREIRFLTNYVNDLQTAGPEAEWFAALGSLHELQARRKWLSQIKQVLAARTSRSS